MMGEEDINYPRDYRVPAGSRAVVQSSSGVPGVVMEIDLGFFCSEVGCWTMAVESREYYLGRKSILTIYIYKQW